MPSTGGAARALRPRDPRIQPRAKGTGDRCPPRRRTRQRGRPPPRSPRARARFARVAPGRGVRSRGCWRVRAAPGGRPWVGANRSRPIALRRRESGFHRAESAWEPDRRCARDGDRRVRRARSQRDPGGVSAAPRAPIIRHPLAPRPGSPGCRCRDRRRQLVRGRRRPAGDGPSEPATTGHLDPHV